MKANPVPKRCHVLQKEENNILPTFLTRLCALAATHVIHSNVFASSQIGECIAITLHYNADLEGTLTNAKLQFISLSNARAKEDGKHDTVEFSNIIVTEIIAIFKELATQICFFHNTVNKDEIVQST